jgi:indolepyruvate ferredoxin oxidoreductase
LNTLLPGLNAQTLDQACKVAEVADSIKGYGPVRHANAQAAITQWERLMKG